MLFGGMLTSAHVAHAPSGEELSPLHDVDSGGHTPSPCTLPSIVGFMSPLSTTPDLDSTAHDAPLHFHAMKNILGVASPPGVIQRGIVEDLLATIGEEPTSVDEALQVNEWHEAMKEKLVSIEEKKTWSLVHRPEGRHAIALKWILKLKCDEHSSIMHHKARLIAKGQI
jgi:hypothetical protein